MGFYSSIVRPLAFCLDAERAHELGMAAIRSGLAKARPFTHPALSQTFFGVSFPNPLGLAAGFDKNAIALDRWDELGFGFVEAGTVTFHPQSGNPKPRMFRLPADRGLINRLGFNNDGAEVVAERLKNAEAAIPIGVNLGKSRIVDVADATQDYAASFQLLHSYGAYAAINVSSPNTPGLRTLQERGPLTEIIQALREIDAEKPLFIKVAPDLELTALDEVAEVALTTGCTGIIATNTTLTRADLTHDPGEAGGLSGAPLTNLSDAILAHLGRTVGGRLTLVGVGGIFNADDLYRKISLGAHLAQLYTGWIYGGPNLVPTLLEGLVARMEREGIGNLEELRGRAEKEVGRKE